MFAEGLSIRGFDDEVWLAIEQENRRQEAPTAFPLPAEPFLPAARDKSRWTEPLAHWITVGP